MNRKKGACYIGEALLKTVSEFAEQVIYGLIVNRHNFDPEKIAETLPDDWPFWCVPDPSQAAAEIKADPRWAEWVRRTKE